MHALFENLSKPIHLIITILRHMLLATLAAMMHYAAPQPRQRILIRVKGSVLDIYCSKEDKERLVNELPNADVWGNWGGIWDADDPLWLFLDKRYDPEQVAAYIYDWVTFYEISPKKAAPDASE